ncbi:mannose-1-phosphate guanylyltransferase, putative [Entamoeba dispar SAW760]|uniref:Mannose-1-phosphate guanylyltransferase, putative n=1 Tax=Entamoeba dispar (strain ATCC PRA-260 / SAW760) TaxID=370354 RepID=B0EAG3_ENTDS|nr:mannose-1-phosphate guanylyltransferase, putative [Entamoeba dispar SAW760]EDR28476.1 mannose-1-phosphate guanylyltransferase, putative [Entamoeba dispar SAW760]|eukprot:EDR28476.1 mannose-1-phosphate guanylyltransferase, putative [Entamoeba dispar SAW760]
MEHRYCVIMAGGVGARFWPLSRESKPKQFLDIMHVGRTFIQMTFDRLSSIIPVKNFIVVTSIQYRELVQEQLPEIPVENILCEPYRRNTAPCVAYASHWIYSRDPEGVMIVAPSDHLITNVKKFINVVNEAFSFIEKHPNKLMTLGMTPTRPETGYGYINYNNNQFIEGSISEVFKFVEKPSIDKALEYLASGNYAWNAGIFLWTAKTIINQLKQFAPTVEQFFEDIKDKFNTSDEVSSVNNAYEKCSSISIDYAVMEKSNDVTVICSEFGWSDVGTWGSLHTLQQKDEQQNVSDGSELYNCHNCIIHKNSNKYVVVEGLNDYIIADTDDALLICSLKNEQKIRDFVSDAKKKNAGVV